MNSVCGVFSNRSYHQILGNQEQSQDPVLLWVISGTTLATTRGKVSRIWHWNFYVAAYGLWNEHHPV